MPEDTKTKCCASQVKEKFGTLRFYMSCETDEMSELIDRAEELSAKICETCGAPGELRNDGWLRTMCDDCHRLKTDRMA